jgi:hypothetical protein
MSKDDPGYDMASRIHKRLENSGGKDAAQTVKVGEGPQRVFHNLHFQGAQHNHGSRKMGERDVEFKGKQRG